MDRISSFTRSMSNMYFKMIYRGFQAYWFLFYSMLISSLIYISFYQLYLPTSQHTKQLNFYYESDCERKVSDGLCSFPKVSIPLHDSDDSVNDGTRVLTRGQHYNFYLELELPLTRINKQLGMFMSQIELISRNGSVITSSSKSTMMSSQDSIFAITKTFVKLVPLFLGFIEEREWLQVPLLENYIDDSYNPAIKVNIAILSKHLHFYSGRLRISAVFSGMRYYMHHWPMLFSLIGFSIVLFIVCSISMLRVAHHASSHAQSNKVPYDYSNLSSAAVSNADLAETKTKSTVGDDDDDAENSSGTGSDEDFA